MRFFYAGSSLVCLCACGGGSGLQFGPINEFETNLTETGDTVALVNANLDVTLPRSPEYESGTFVAGATADETQPTQILAFSETDDTFAAILRSTDGGTAADVFVGRTSDIETLPKGTAMFEGDYKGTWTEEDETRFGALITGDATLNVDFDAMTVSGEITNRTTGLFGLRGSNGDFLPFLLSFDLQMRNGTLSNDGTFRGDILAIEKQDTVETILSEDGGFDGLLDGANATEGVGRISVNLPGNEGSGDLVERPPYTEVGVFAVGH